jgi:hypothetical protein
MKFIVLTQLDNFYLGLLTLRLQDAPVLLQSHIQCYLVVSVSDRLPASVLVIHSQN